MTTIASLVVEIGADISDFTRGMNTVDKQIDKSKRSIGGAVQELGRSVSGLGMQFTAATAPLAGAFAYGIKTASDFEGVMAEISARAGLTGEDLKKVSDFALQMGADTAFSGQQAAEAFLQLLTSGQTAEQAIATLPAVLDAAAASGEDLGHTADVITDIMASFGLGVEDAGSVVDSLARAAGASSADMGDLGQGFANVGGVARAFGLKVDRTAAILAVLSENGIKGAEAGTALKSMLLNMTRPTEVVAGAWEALGTSFYDSEGNARDLTDILADIKTGMEDMPVNEQNELLYQLGGSYGIVALQALLGANSIEEMEAAMAASTGVSEVAAARMDTFAGRMDSLKGSVETLMIKALTPFMENVLTPMAEKITAVVNEITAWTDENPELTSQIVAVAAAALVIGPALVVAGIGIQAIGVAIGALGVAIGILTSPLFLAAAGLLAIGAGLAYIWSQDIGGIRTKIEEIANTISSTDFKGAAEDFKTNLETQVNTALTQFQVDAMALQNRVAFELEAALLRVVLPVMVFKRQIETQINDAFAQIQIDATNFINPIRNDIVNNINTSDMAMVGDSLVARLTFGISSAFYGLKDGRFGFAAQSLVNMITGDVYDVTLNRAISEFSFEPLTKAIQDNLSNAITNVQGATVDTSGIETWANDNMQSILDTVVAVAGIVLGGPIGMTIGAAKLISTAIENDFLGIGTFLKDSGIQASVETAFNDLKGIIDGVLQDVFSGGGSNTDGALAEMFASGQAVQAPAMSGPMKTFVDDIKMGLEWLSGELPKITGPISDGLAALGDGIGGFIANLSGTETEGLLRIATTVGGAIGVIVTKLAELGANIVGDVLTNIGEALPSIGAFINDFVSALSRLGEGDWAGAAQRLGEGLMSFVDAGLALVGIDFGSVITTLSGLWDSVALGIETFKTNIAAAFEWIKVNVIDPIVAAIDGIKQSLTDLGGGLGAYGGAANNLGAALNSGASPGDFLGALVQAIGDEINPPHGDNGLKVATEGLIYAHPGERLLNPGETRAYESGGYGGGSVTFNGVSDIDQIIYELRRRGYDLDEMTGRR